jgi:hypothetical protein
MVLIRILDLQNLEILIIYTEHPGGAALAIL